MDPFWLGIIGLCTMCVLLFLGLYVGVALGLVGLVGLMILIGPKAAIYSSATLAYDRMSNFDLIVLPLFVLMGFFGEQGELGARSFQFLRLWTGRIKGGLGIATVGACTIFGTMCGSSLVTAAVFAQLSAPEMRRLGYDKRFAYGICTSAGVIGMLIPPSLLIVYYGILTQDSIGRLLVAGTSPGLMLFFIFSIGIYVMVSMKPALAKGVEEPSNWSQRLHVLLSIWPVLLSVLIIMGGIFSGIFSPSEAGAVACVFLFGISLFLKKGDLSGLLPALLGTISTCSMIYLIFIGAGLFSRFLVLSTVGPQFLALVTRYQFSPLTFLIIITICYLILGCFFDSISMLSITIPVLYPAAMKLNIDPTHLAMVIIVAVEAGLITPPVGFNLFAVKGVAEKDVTLGDLYMGSLPFVLMMMTCLLLIILFPVFSTWLPGLMTPK
ncbi:MAG: TRAP transporter large permease [Deltaproteobacteria bacterium]|nr:TRAP transporter large permease [Deltaproteobacteria bacterium]